MPCGRHCPLQTSSVWPLLHRKVQQSGACGSQHANKFVGSLCCGSCKSHRNYDSHDSPLLFSPNNEYIGPRSVDDTLVGPRFVMKVALQCVRHKSSVCFKVLSPVLAGPQGHLVPPKAAPASAPSPPGDGNSTHALPQAAATALPPASPPLIPEAATGLVKHGRQHGATRVTKVT